jgi:zinc protease
MDAKSDSVIRRVSPVWIGCMAVLAMGLALWSVGCTHPDSTDKDASVQTKDVVSPEAAAPEPSGMLVADNHLSKEYVVLDERADRLIVELPNRMVVVAQELPTAPVVTAQAWVKTGSIFEQEHVGAGLSHFLEHLLAGGSTSNRDEQASNAVLGRIGAQTNAATGHDNVRYYVNTVSENTDDAIDLVSDWMQNALITDAEYARERSVIQREMEMRNSQPNIVLWKLSQLTRYQAHPARDPIIGYLDEFKTITRDEIYDFYKRMYVPNNMVFLVVGDIDKQAVVDRVAALWSDVPAGQLPEVSLPIEPAIDGPREASRYADIEIPKLRLIWPGTKLGDEGDYELDVLSMVLGQGESSRLKRNVRDDLRLATSVSAYNSSSVWTEGYFTVTAEPTDREASLDELKAALLAEVAALRDTPVTQAELDRAKRKVLADIAQNNQSAEEVASTLAWEVISMAEPGYLKRYAEAVQSLTAEDMQAVAKKYLTDDRLITVALLPKQEGQDDDIPLTKRQAPPIDLATIEHQPVELDNEALIHRLGKNLASAPDDTAGIEVDKPVTYKLDNGLTVVVQRSTVVPAVAIRLLWTGGLLADEPGREGVANAVASMLTRGTNNLTADQISETVEDLGATLGAKASNNTAYASATALSDDWPVVLNLLGEVTTQPAFDDGEWDKLKPRLLAAIDRAGETWIGELRQAFRSEFFGDHPWSQVSLGRREVVESLTTDDLRAFHTAHLNASQVVLSVVGDVDPDAVHEAAKQLFGSLPANPDQMFEPLTPKTPEARIVQVATTKPATAFYIGFAPGVSRDDPNYPALAVLATVMSDFPAGWLEQELRGRGPGLVYSVGASAWAGLVPGYTGVIFNTSAPQAVEALQRTMSVIQRAKAGGFDPADIQRAKAKVLTREFFGKQSLGDRAMLNALDVMYGLNDPGSMKFLKAVSETDAQTLTRMANEHLNHPVIVVLTNTPLNDAQLEAASRGELIPVEESAEVDTGSEE